MPRRSDIIPAFYSAIKIEPSGRRVVTTGEFVRQLAEVNYHWSLAQANDWIRLHTHAFRDITLGLGEDKLWFMFNSNGGI